MSALAGVRLVPTKSSARVHSNLPLFWTEMPDVSRRLRIPQGCQHTVTTDRNLLRMSCLAGTALVLAGSTLYLYDRPTFYLYDRPTFYLYV